jgi:regulator of sirC expression with transglutaminase-like and TPR domain
VEVDFAGSDFAEGHDRGLVLAGHEGRVALHDLAGALGSEDNEGEAVFLALEAIFDGNAGHGG